MTFLATGCGGRRQGYGGAQAVGDGEDQVRVPAGAEQQAGPVPDGTAGEPVERAPADADVADGAGAFGPAAMSDAGAGHGPDAALARVGYVSPDWCHRWQTEPSQGRGTLWPTQVIATAAGELVVAGLEVRIVERFSFGGGGTITDGGFLQRFDIDGLTVGPGPVLERGLATLAVAELPHGGTLLAGFPVDSVVPLADGGHSMTWLDASDGVSRRAALAMRTVLQVSVDAQGTSYGLLAAPQLPAGRFGWGGTELRSWDTEGVERWAVSTDSRVLSLALSPDGGRLVALGSTLPDSMEQAGGAAPAMELLDTADGRQWMAVALRDAPTNAGFVEGHFDSAGGLYAIGVAHAGEVGQHFVERFDRDGQPLWPKRISLGDGVPVGVAIAAAVDAHDNLVVALPEVDLAAGTADIHVTALTPAGAAIWAEPMRFDGGQGAMLFDLAVGGDGAVYLLLRAGGAHQLCRLPPRKGS